MNLKKLSTKQLTEHLQATNFWISGRWAGQTFMRDCERFRNELTKELLTRKRKARI